MKNRSIIALSLMPSGCIGCRAALQSKETYSILKEENVSWNEFGQRTSEAQHSLSSLIRNLSDSSQKTPVYASIHPHWVLSTEYQVPPTSDYEISKYLSLQIEKEWPSNNGHSSPRWTWNKIEGTNRAAVFLLRGEIAEALERAISDAGCTLALITFSPSAHAALMKKEETVYFSVHHDQLTLCHYKASVPVAVSVLDLPADENSPVDSYIKQAIVDFAASSNTQMVAVDSMSRNLARTISIETVDGDLQSPAWKIVPAGKNPTDDEVTLYGLLELAKREKSSAPDFRATVLSRSDGDQAIWHSPRKVFLFLVVAAVAAIATFIIRQDSEERNLQAARKQVASVAFDEFAARENVKVLSELVSDDVNLLDLLLAVTGALPQGVSLESFSMDPKGNVSITGKVGDLSTVEQLTMSLGQTDQFTRARTESTTIQDKVVKYTITAQVEKK